MGVRANPRNGLDQVIQLCLVGSQLIDVVDPRVGRVQGQLATLVQQRIDFIQRALRRLHHRHGGFAIVDRLANAGDLRAHLFANDQSRRVVGSLINFEPTR